MVSLEEFLDFLKTTWGLLAGISVFFPLSNKLLNVVPIPKGQEQATTTFSTIACIFFVYAAFNFLNLVLSLKRNKFAFNTALVLILILSLCSFYAGYNGFSDLLNGSFQPSAYSDPRRNIYVFSSVGLTAGFTFMGMFQYLRQKA